MTLAFIINFVIVFALNFWSYNRGWQAGQQNMIRKMADNPDVMLEAFTKVKALQDDDPENGVEVNVEEHDGIYYLYKSCSNEFIAQGVSIDQAFEAALSRFPDQSFWYSTDDNAAA